MVTSKTRNLFASWLWPVLLFASLGACKPLWELDPIEPAPTCGGNEPSSLTNRRLVIIRNSISKCLEPEVIYRANSNAEAQQCAEDDFPGPGLDFITSGVPQGRCVVAISPSSCMPTQLNALSSADAIACVQSSCANCQIQDVTSSVLYLGAINSTQCANWCENNGYP